MWIPQRVQQNAKMIVLLKKGNNGDCVPYLSTFLHLNLDSVSRIVTEKLQAMCNNYVQHVLRLHHDA